MPLRIIDPIPALLILLPLVAFLLRPSAASVATNPLYNECSKPLRCNNISVSYPFRIQDSPTYCGVPGYDLYCDEHSNLNLNLDGDEYRVKEINYEQGFFTVVNSDFLGSDCPLTFRNTSYNSTLFDLVDFDWNVTVYVNCTTQISPTGFQDIPCMGNVVGLKSYFKLQKGVASSLLDLLESCQLTAAVPLSESAAMSLYSSSREFGKALQQGFGMKWSAGNDWCKGCIDAGGICGYNSSRATDPICFCANQNVHGSCRSGKTGEGHSVTVKVAIGLIVGLVCFLLVSISSYFWICQRRGLNTNKISQTIEAFLVELGNLGPKRYKYSALKKITKSFSEKLGQGGYGSVFRGQLPDGRLVAVKILTDATGNGDEFVNEVASIGRTSHVNVVGLLGYSSEGSKRALIYEFMSNGSLEKYIYSENLKSTLGWEKLYQIALGIARGLEYLHRGCTTRIVHFDIKPHNILLDQDFCPKISDFGLAKLCLRKDSVFSAIYARGTAGYIAPEVFSRNFGVVSSKSDVYSYGMMVMEMVGGRNSPPPGNDSYSDQYFFPHWIHQHFHEVSRMDGLDGSVQTEEIAKKMILVGLWCIQTNPGSRPPISKVVDMLENSVDDIEMPPKPS